MNRSKPGEYQTVKAPQRDFALKVPGKTAQGKLAERRPPWVEYDERYLWD